MCLSVGAAGAGARVKRAIESRRSTDDTALGVSNHTTSAGDVLNVPTEAVAG
jgi:hypothetical protein